MDRNGRSQGGRPRCTAPTYLRPTGSTPRRSPATRARSPPAEGRRPSVEATTDVRHPAPATAPKRLSDGPPGAIVGPRRAVAQEIAGGRRPPSAICSWAARPEPEGFPVRGQGVVPRRPAGQRPITLRSSCAQGPRPAGGPGEAGVLSEVDEELRRASWPVSRNGERVASPRLRTGMPGPRKASPSPGRTHPTVLWRPPRPALRTSTSRAGRSGSSSSPRARWRHGGSLEPPAPRTCPTNGLAVDVTCCAASAGPRSSTSSRLSDRRRDSRAVPARQARL